MDKELVKRSLPSYRIPRDLYARNDGIIFPVTELLTPENLRSYITRFGDKKPASILMQAKRVNEMGRNVCLWDSCYDPATKKEIIHEGKLGIFEDTLVFYTDYYGEPFLPENFLAVYPESK